MVHFLYGQMKHAIDVAAKYGFHSICRELFYANKGAADLGILGLSIMNFRYKVIIRLRYWQ